MKKHREIIQFLWLFISFLILHCNCQSPINLLGASISYTYGASSTQFIVTFPLTSGITQQNVWLGIGFNSAPAMVNIIIIFILF